MHLCACIHPVYETGWISKDLDVFLHYRLEKKSQSHKFNEIIGSHPKLVLNFIGYESNMNKNPLALLNYGARHLAPLKKLHTWDLCITRAPIWQ